MRGDADPHRDRGFASIVAVAVIAVVLIAVAAVLNLASASAGRHRAEAAADLAALAAASHAISGEEAACAHAAQVTDGMEVRLVSCRLSGWDAFIETEARPTLSLLPGGRALGRARAGPVER